MRALPWYLSMGIAGWFSVAQSFSGETNRSVFPQGFESQSGNSGGVLFSGAIPTYQQLFRASSLSAEWSGPVLIHEIAFRVNDGASSFSATILHIEMRLSTSAKTPENMSRFWEENRGLDDTVVYSQNNVLLSAQGNVSINPFDLQFTFQKPFFYDPMLGNLLLYVENTGGAGTRSLDAQGYPSLQSSPFAASAASTTPNQPPFEPSPGGLITEFTWTSIPEPKNLGLVLTGVIVLSLANMFHKRH